MQRPAAGSQLHMHPVFAEDTQAGKQTVTAEYATHCNATKGASLEVDEDALGGFRAQVAHLVAAGADAGLEHQVEGEGGADVVACVWSLDAVLCQGCPQARRIQLLYSGQQVLDLLQGVRNEMGFSQMACCLVMLQGASLG